EILGDVLLADPAHGDLPACAGRDRDAEDLLGEKDALRVMAEGTVAEVGDDLLRLVEPGVDRQVVVDLAAPFAYARLRVMEGMGHQMLMSMALSMSTACSTVSLPSIQQR